MSLPSLSPGASEIELVASPAAVQSLPSDDLCSAPPSPTSEPTASTAPTSIVPTTSTVEEEEDIKPTLEMVSTQDELDPHLQDVKPEAEFIPLDSDPNITLTPHGLPPVQTKLNTKWADVFFRYCAERHMVYEKKAKGLPKEQWTNDEVIQKTRIGNCYSELDRDSEKVKNEVILAGDQSHQEMCCTCVSPIPCCTTRSQANARTAADNPVRVFLFCGFYLMSTWDALVQGLGHIPSWKDFDLKKYEAILYEKSRKGKIYYGGFQLVPPTKYFGGKLPHYAATLRFVQSLMEMDMPSKLLECKYAVDASHIIQTAPTLGGFLSLCMLCYFNEAPHLHWTYRNWASCGPGSRAFLQRIFGQRTINSTPMEQSALVWLHTNQWKYWHNIGIDPPHAWEIGLRPGLRVLDIENSLCWCHRYVHSAERKGYGSVLNKGPLLQREGDASMPAWCDEEQYTRGKNQVAFKGDYTEEKDKLAALEADQGVFEIEKVVCRTGNRKDKDGLFRVRWKGYPPEEDTWERASNLRNGAAEVSPKPGFPFCAAFSQIHHLHRLHLLLYATPSARCISRC